MYNSFRKSLNLIGNVVKYSQKVAKPLPQRKGKAAGNSIQSFIDSKQIRVIGGSGGDGCISFLHLWCNDMAGPDGGDGGHGGHVIFQASTDIRDLHHIPTSIRAANGEKGGNKDCHGKNASHCILKVPIGTVIKNCEGKVVGDLTMDGLMFIAAKGGGGGKGNHYFITDTQQSPEISEYGANGENLEYIIEIRSMAHVGLIGLPNAGKSTLLRAISRARPKVAPYPFTTIKPHLGIVEYDDYEQLAVADLPGLIPDSHKNRGLGIQFLKHTERCMALLFVIDASMPEPWKHFDILQHELDQFSDTFQKKPRLIAANKIDLPEAKENLDKLQEESQLPVIPISAKTGLNIDILLREMKIIYDDNAINDEDNNEL